MRQLELIKKYFIFTKNKYNNRDARIWVFGEWFGKKCGDNATYLANFIAQNYSAINVYWLCCPDCDTSVLDASIKVIDYCSQKAVEISKKAGVAVVVEGIIDLNNQNYNYWGNALKVNLWHGVPWKKIGYDMPNNNRRKISNFFRNKTYTFDLFQSPSQEYTSHILTAFDSSEKKICKAGLPRNALFFDETAIQKCSKKITRRLNLLENVKIIAYLPTFRDSQTKPYSFAKIPDTFFYDWLVENNIYIVQKAHEAEQKSFDKENEHIISVFDISAQELMAASDMLITDYSSCFFDYLLLDRPIIHYLYDYEYYKNMDRGLYYEKEEVVCGSAPETEEDLIKAIKYNFENPKAFHDLRMDRKEKFMTYETPNSCEIITQRIFDELRKRE